MNKRSLALAGNLLLRLSCLIETEVENGKIHELRVNMLTLSFESSMPYRMLLPRDQVFCNHEDKNMATS